MKISELLSELHTWNDALITRDWTVDTLKEGLKNHDDGRDVTKIGVTMFASADVIQKAAAEGVELLITHEPVFYQDAEKVDENDPVHTAKRKLLDDAGITVFRYHDHPHFMPLDLIDEGAIRASKLAGKITGKLRWAITGFELDIPMSAAAVAAALEENLGLKHIRIVGNASAPGRGIAFACGTPGHILETLKRDDVDFVVTGEICEWGDGEYVRDWAAMGGKKALLVLGHCGSERAGMKLFTEQIAARHPELAIHYFETPELYTYTGS